MSKLTKIFQNIPETSPSPALKEAVLHKIELLEEAKSKRERFWSYAGFAGSIAAFAYVIFAFGGSFIQSEFWSIISLVFSDMRVVAANWQSFVYSALETFPLVSVIAMLIPTFVLLWSFSVWASIHRKNQHHYIYN